jgi:dUTP pyrophosphatase
MRTLLYIKSDNTELESLYKGALRTQWDAGVDLFCPEEVRIPAKSQGKIDFQVKTEMIKSPVSRGSADAAWWNSYADTTARVGTGFIIAPRSSIVKTPLRMSNSIGIIDAGYRGNLMAFVDNISDTEFVIEKGTRLFQIVAPDFSPIDVVVTNKLSNSIRGEGGFGSTGK